MRIVESYPGELEEMSPEAFEDRVRKAVAIKTRQVRGGELRLIEDLAREMSEAYNQRLGQFMDDFAELEITGQLESWSDNA